MTYYAHTKQNPDGSPAPESAWQPLAVHLTNVATLAAKFAERWITIEEADAISQRQLWTIHW